MQDLVDELSHVLARSVLMLDAALCLVAASAQRDDIDDLQVRTLLARTTPAAERARLESLGVTRTRHPMNIELHDLDAHDRLVIPIWGDDQQLGSIWLIKTGHPPLKEEHFRAIDATVSVASALMQARSRGTARSMRDRVFQGLLADDVTTRREALALAVRQHGLVRGPETIIRALAVGHEATALQRAALSNALEHSAGHALTFIGEADAALLFIGGSGDNERIENLIASESERAGVRLRAVGCAALPDGETDLQSVADRAVATAMVVEAVPDLGPSAQAEQVGPWLLLADVLAHPERLEWYSPAAHVLLNDADSVRRQTVEALLDSANHIREVCETLHIHRTTLYYRLENMPAVVREALDDGMRRSTLHFALKLFRLWENSGRVR